MTDKSITEMLRKCRLSIKGRTFNPTPLVHKET